MVDDVDGDDSKSMVQKNTCSNELIHFNKDSTIKSIQQTQKIVQWG